MSVVVGVDVVVKLLVFGVLLVAQFTVEVGSQFLQSFGYGFLLLHLVLWVGGQQDNVSIGREDRN